MTPDEAAPTAADDRDGARRDEHRERMAVNGLLVIISAPSGAGKDSVIERLVKELEDAVVYVTAASRAPRPGEQHGIHYYFYEPPKFREEI